MIKKVALFDATIMVIICLCSCGIRAMQDKKQTVLNDWQKEVLTAEGLPTEADQLTESQFKSIQRIYEMITYLNEKYNEEFTYAGYLEPAANQTETLYAYPRLLGNDYGRNTVTVKATKDGFTDDYSNRSIVDYAEEMANDFMKEYFNSDQVIAFFKVNACDIKKGEVVDGDFQWKLGVSDVIFVNENICNADQVEEFAVKYAKWLYEHELSGLHRINIIKNCDITEISYVQISTYYKSNDYLGFYSIYFDSDKKNVKVVKNLDNNSDEQYSIIDYFSKYN